MPSLSNVFEQPGEQRGQWGQQVFGNDNPITAELGCGYGEYVMALARRFPECNYIGVDVKGTRLWKGATTMLNEGRRNAAFIRTLIEWIDRYIGQGELSEIWITFPDPQPRPAKAMKRLTSLRYLEIYQKLLKPGGSVHFKTDNQGLFEWTLDGLAALGNQIVIHRQSNNLYGESWLDDILSIPTRFENAFRQEGYPIHYLHFSFADNKALPTETEWRARMPAGKQYEQRTFHKPIR